MSNAPIAPLNMLPLDAGLNPLSGASHPASAGMPFAQMLSNGIEEVNAKQLDADKMVHAFALDDTIPVHQVTFALEQAQLSLELMLQVRNRLLEGYQQLMNMQL
jgi:flagellar hook-basal body complex protein FliE